MATTRHRGQVVLFGARAELESPQEAYLAGGPPKTDLDRLRRVALQVAERAKATETSADDRPVLDDLGSAAGPHPTHPTHPTHPNDPPGPPPPQTGTGRGAAPAAEPLGGPLDGSPSALGPPTSRRRRSTTGRPGGAGGTLAGADARPQRPVRAGTAQPGPRN